MKIVDPNNEYKKVTKTSVLEFINAERQMNGENKEDKKPITLKEFNKNMLYYIDAYGYEIE